MAADLLTRLATFDTPTICNCIELFDVRPRTRGYMDGRIKACFPDMPPIVGYAATAAFSGSSPDQSERDGYSAMADQVARFGELSGPPLMVFQDVDDPPIAATFGEIMCATYQAFGAIGLITSGAGRDLQQVRAMNFTVFASSTVCAHGYSAILRLHEQVMVGGVLVCSDDLLHADCNGVTTIPLEIAADVADAVAEYAACEAIILGALRESALTANQLANVHTEARAQMAGLRKRVAMRA
jgi:4-hydroxy-4-methyl-2-oxoglutarate aldolase